MNKAFIPVNGKSVWAPLLALVLFSLGGCQMNPVTGERNFQIYGSDWEQQVGGQMYAPMRQSQGGDFVIDPALTAYVNEVGQRLATQARRKELKYEFSIINSSVPNAWCLPGGKVVVNRGLLTELKSEAELAAVLGHEIVHADAAHGARQQSTGMLAQIGAVASMVILGSKVENQAAREIAMLVPTVGAQLIMQKYGRDAERESDLYGTTYMSEAGYDPQGAVTLQETFLRLSEGRNEDWLSGLFASHPPSKERVENNRKTVATLPAGGESGRDKYEQKTAFLRRVEPAYKAYDVAAKALSENRLDDAQASLSQAIKAEPREPLFHALQGDILVQKKNPKQALAAYERSIKAYDAFFYTHLRKGQLEYQQKQRAPARANLERSLQLLPTAEAHYLLGLLDRDEGQQQKAMAHFQAASQSKSDSGRLAQREVILVDLPRNPANYVAVRPAIDRSNQVWMQIGNGTDIALKNIEVAVTWLDDSGQTRQGRKVYPGPLPGGKQDQVNLNLKLTGVQDLSQRIRLQVSAAELAE